MTNYYVGLPELIRVGPYNVKVKVVNKVTVGGKKTNCWGAWQPDRGPIELRREQNSPKDALDTLCHEIFHAIYSLDNITKGPREEPLVNAFGTWWSAVLVDNPLLVKWLVEIVLDKDGIELSKSKRF